MLRQLTFALAALGGCVFPRLAAAQCSYSASPSVALSWDRTMLSPVTAIPAIAEDWTIGCSPVDCDSSKTKYFWDDVRLVYAAEPTTEISGVGSLSAGDDPTVNRGHTVLNESLAGVRIVARFSAGCGDSGGVTSSDLVMAPQTEPFVVPPYLPPPEQITIKIDDASFPGLPIAIGTQVPLGQKFHIAVALGATPKGAETLGVHLEGAGISFEKYYQQDPSAPDANIGEQLAADPAAQFQAKSQAPISFWLDFEGRGSLPRKLTVVAYDQEGMPVVPGDAGASDDGGGDGSDAGTPDTGTTDASSAGAAGSAETAGGIAGVGAAPTSDGSSNAGNATMSSPSGNSSSNGGGCAVANTTGSPRAELAILALALACRTRRRRTCLLRQLKD
jgi:hypothetical protein